MVYIIDNKEYSTLKQYFFDKHPDRLTVTENEVSRYVYHTVPEIREKKRTFYREKYRNKNNGNVRGYFKFNPKFVSGTVENG